jgi:hypothetical protein
MGNTLEGAEGTVREHTADLALLAVSHVEATSGWATTRI